MATSIQISEKRGPDRSSAPKTLSFDEKIAKIGSPDPEIIVLQENSKKRRRKTKKRKKLKHAKYIALPASLPCGLKKRHKIFKNVKIVKSVFASLSESVQIIRREVLRVY